MAERQKSDTRTLSPIEEIAASPVARTIADVLAHTRLAYPDGPADDAAHWSDPPVLEATRRLLARFDAEGYTVVSRTQE